MDRLSDRGGRGGCGGGRSAAGAVRQAYGGAVAQQNGLPGVGGLSAAVGGGVRRGWLRGVVEKGEVKCYYFRGITLSNL